MYGLQKSSSSVKYEFPATEENRFTFRDASTTKFCLSQQFLAKQKNPGRGRAESDMGYGGLSACTTDGGVLSSTAGFP